MISLKNTCFVSRIFEICRWLFPRVTNHLIRRREESMALYFVSAQRNEPTCRNLRSHSYLSNSNQTSTFMHSSAAAMSSATSKIGALLCFALVLPALTGLAQTPDVGDWAVHDLERPQPKWIDTGHGAATPQPAPADAIVLFDGTDLSEWVSQNDGSPAKWKVEGGYFEVAPETGGIRTKREFGDAQIHIEWASPNPPRGEGQDNGNSGVFLMNMYEVQVLNSYENKTYPDGQASAVYGQYPPLVNATRPPGEWQTYDIIFHRPRFAADGSVDQFARVTVFHNGVLVQNNVILTGPTGHKSRPPYRAHADRLPISLQDHDHPVRFRNIWVRDLEQ